MSVILLQRNVDLELRTNTGLEEWAEFLSKPTSAIQNHIYFHGPGISFTP